MGTIAELKTIFGKAVALEVTAEQAAYLDEVCAGNPELRNEVESLLKAHQDVGPFLRELSPMPVATIEQPITERPGAVIGPYKLLEQIGEGGFGVVFMADQTQPVRRKVALKILKPGMDTRQVVARFEAERQALAIMDHPNIAKVLDGGATATGRPYFVMDLVKGVPISEFCDQNQLAPRQRLELFIPVCQAVQHAHQKGIIHRDLKPSNVLVAVHDTMPVVKVIDFGVAKALGQELTDKTLFTSFAQMIGTPLYMSPEQAGQSGLDIDTRSDIYSMGVLLYELLTGTTPFDKERLRTATFDEIRRIIREEEPPKPSTRLTTLGQAASTVCENRQSDPRQLSQLVRGELDWIVMKALEKDRNRRYESASAFAADVSRYLHDERVLACPPTVGYRARKFIRRYRGPVVAIAVVLLALIGGVIGTTWGMIRAQRAQQAEARRAEAEAKERQRADSAEGEAKKHEQEAKGSLQLATAIVQFLRKDLLGVAGSAAQADRHFQPNPNLTIREALDRAADGVGDEFKDQPEMEAGIRKTVGEAYRQLGQYEKAIAQLKLSANTLAQRLGPDHLATLDTLHSLALAYWDAQMTAEAIKLYEQVRDAQVKSLGAEHSHTLTTLDNLAVAYRDAGRLPAARALFEQVRHVRTTTLGPNDPATLCTLHNIATMDLEDGKTTEAIAQFEQIFDAKIKVLGPDHPDTLPTLHNLATAYWKARQLDRSIPLFEKLLPLHQRILGETHPTTLGAMANLGVNYRDAGRLAEAIPLLEQAHRDVAKYESLQWVGAELLIAYVRVGNSAAGSALAQDNLATVRKALPADSPQLADALARCGLTLLELKAWDKAEPILRDCVAIRETKGPDDWRTFNAKSMLGKALLHQAKYADAEPLLLQGYTGMKEREAKIPKDSWVRLIEALERLAQLYDDWGQPDQAAEWRIKLETERTRQAN